MPFMGDDFLVFRESEPTTFANRRSVLCVASTANDNASQRLFGFWFVQHLNVTRPSLPKDFGLKCVVLHGGQVAVAEASVAVIWHSFQPLLNVCPEFLVTLELSFQIAVASRAVLVEFWRCRSGCFHVHYLSTILASDLNFHFAITYLSSVFLVRSGLEMFVYPIAESSTIDP